MIWSITIFINKIRWVFYEKNNSRWFRKSECLSNCKMTIAQNFLNFLINESNQEEQTLTVHEYYSTANSYILQLFFQKIHLHC